VLLFGMTPAPLSTYLSGIDDAIVDQVVVYGLEHLHREAVVVWQEWGAVHGMMDYWHPVPHKAWQLRSFEAIAECVLFVVQAS
jgi:hypothetical protein